MDFTIVHDLADVSRVARAAGRRGELGAKWNVPGRIPFFVDCPRLKLWISIAILF